MKNLPIESIANFTPSFPDTFRLALSPHKILIKKCRSILQISKTRFQKMTNNCARIFFKKLQSIFVRDYWFIVINELPVSSSKLRFTLVSLNTLTNSADSEEMQHSVAFHLGLHCLPKYPFRKFQYTKDPGIFLLF